MTVYIAIDFGDDRPDIMDRLARDDNPFVRSFEVALRAHFGAEAVMVGVVRDGVILKVAQAQAALRALESLDVVPDAMTPEDAEAATAIRACLEVIQGHGG